jgi:hypothetical protein
VNLYIFSLVDEWGNSQSHPNEFQKYENFHSKVISAPLFPKKSQKLFYA